MRVLLIDDYAPLAHALQMAMSGQGLSVDVADDGKAAERKAETAEYDVIILDMDLPDEGGLALLKRWRGKGVKAHVLVLTARADAEDKVAAFNLGADACMTKPFQLEELLARLRALTRRGQGARDPVPRVHDLEIDTNARTVKRGGRSIHMTRLQFSILELLASHRGTVVTRAMIREHLYGEHESSTSNVVDVYIRYLRHKIDKDFTPALIRTRWGQGYFLSAE